MIIQKVGIIGAGTMGNGIAQACAVVGIPVVMVDISEAAVAKGIATVSGSLDRLLKKEKITCKRSSSGLYFKILEEGQGEQIRYSDIVSFTYRGTLLNGKVFDKQDEPVEFEVKQLIGAWKEIMLELKPGGKAFLVAPPHLGYGEHELAHIPPHSILVFELEVKNVR